LAMLSGAVLPSCQFGHTPDTVLSFIYLAVIGGFAVSEVDRFVIFAPLFVDKGATLQCALLAGWA